MDGARGGVDFGAAVEPALRLRDVDVERDGRLVLAGVGFDVWPGEIVALVGENGAGKSTLLGAVMGAVRLSRGEICVLGERMGRGRPRVHRSVSAVWQDLELCSTLSVAGNLYLGHELGRGFLARRRMWLGVAEAYERIGLVAPEPGRSVGLLSRGQQQMLALSKALLHSPRVLLLDEPTSALAVEDVRRVEDLLRCLRDGGTAVVLISHRVEQVMGLADRVVALRHGRLVSDTTTVELGIDDVVALMSGLQHGLTSRRHLRRIADLVEQLADIEPSASLPLIVSALATTFTQHRLCVHVVEPGRSGDLRVGATVRMRDEDVAALGRVPLGDHGFVAESARTGAVVVVASGADGTPPVAGTEKVASGWSVPVVGDDGAVLGVLSGLADVPGRPPDDQLELLDVYAGLAATALERERLLRSVTQHNRMLETLRCVLDALAGPTPGEREFAGALEQLRGGLGATGIGVFRAAGETGSELLRVDLAGGAGVAAPPDLAVAAVARDPAWTTGVRDLAERTLGVPFLAGEQRGVLVATWAADRRPGVDEENLLENAGWSLNIAVARRDADRARAEAQVLRRTSDLQRDFVHRLSHELRTPLTTVFGYASTLRQSDVTWDPEEQDRFLAVIAAESRRMRRLVDDLLDFSALTTGHLALHPDWCDVALVARAAVSALGTPGAQVAVRVGPAPAVWADHDRLEQVLLNLVENAMRHGASRAVVSACTIGHGPGQIMRIDVADDGPGVSDDDACVVFEPYETGATIRPGAGLGLSICAAIVGAHGGTIAFVPSTRGATVRVELPVEPGAA